MAIKQTAIRGRTGVKPKSPFNPNPDKDSKRSIKRRSRGFRSLLTDSRKHRRAERRLAISQNIMGTRYPAGEAIELTNLTHIHHSGGAMKYHAT